jgi:hypothetical protein
MQKSFGLSGPVADELGKLVDLVLRDYVEFWYDPVSSDRQVTYPIQPTSCPILPRSTACPATRTNTFSS